MQVGDDGRHRILPFEAEGQVQHDAQHHEGQRLEAVRRQFLADLRADEFGAAQRSGFILRLQCRHHLVALLRRADALLRRQPDQHVA